MFSLSCFKNGGLASEKNPTDFFNRGRLDFEKSAAAAAYLLLLMGVYCMYIQA